MSSFYDFIPTDLAPKETIAGQVREYEAGVAAIQELHEVTQRCCKVVSVRVSRDRCPLHLTFDLEHALKEHLKEYWRRIIAKMQVEQACSATRWREIEGQIEEGDVPDFTEGNIESLCRSFLQELPQMFQEACKEVLEWLLPGAWERGYKTNEKNARMEIGKKVVKSLMVEYWSRSCPPSLNYGREKILRSLHTVFKMLDDQGIARYPHDLPTQLREAMKDSRCREFRNEYFFCRWFLNGNMHIEILRDDLLKEFNCIVHGNTLREPSAAEQHDIVPSSQARAGEAAPAASP